MEKCSNCGTEIQLRVRKLIQHSAPPGGWGEYYTAKVVIACECTTKEPKTGQKSIDLYGEVPEQWQ